jgi:glutamine amidotransferase
LNSVKWALERAGGAALVTPDPAAAEAAAGLVLPGVGNFARGAERLQASGWDEVLRRRVWAVPTLGICLGMQLLLEGSDEGGRGLGVLPGWVERMDAPALPLPHMGWNQVAVRHAAGILGRLGDGEAYFCHTYAVRPADPLRVAAVTDYGGPFASAVQCGPLVGVQFHPEKSGRYGARLLALFVEEVTACSTASPPSTWPAAASSA